MEFYRGKLAENLVQELQKQGVKIELEDFMNHTGFKAKPLKMELDGKVILEIPPNSQGISTLQMISALYEECLDRYSFNDERILAWAEPIERIYNFRDINVGDPSYMDLDLNHYKSFSSLSKKS